MNNAMNATLKVLGVLALAVGFALPAKAQTLDTVRLTAGLSAPLWAGAAPGDTSRIFIAQQGGLVRVFKNGSLLATPFINATAKILTGSERGLLGMAFHPDYTTNGYFFLSYTRAGDGASIVERYSVSTGNPDVADPLSGLVFIGPVAQPESNHNGGGIAFSPVDRMLYYGLGDGGGGNDQHGAIGNGQLGTTLLGKMLRYDVDIASPYIPAGNPYSTDPNVRDEVWDVGMRNPWRWSFDRQYGDMFIADVGQGAREEVNYEPVGNGGHNYGWRCMEGVNCTGLSGCTCNSPALTLPIDDYSHSFGLAIIGGYIYRGCAMPALQGTYFYSDNSSARIWSFTYDRNTNTKGPTIERTSELAPGGGLFINSVTSFGEDGFGEILIVDGGGELFKIVQSGQTDCNANGTADSCDLASGNSLDVNGNSIPDECDCTAPAFHCTAKFTAGGCLPVMGYTGYSSATRGFGFHVRGVGAINQKPGLLLYGFNGPASTPLSGGLLCVNPPLRRTVGANSGGSALPADDCSGVFTIDLNLFAVGGLGGNPDIGLLLPGNTVNAQWWGRDPGFAAPDNVQLTNGLTFQICP